ncbi:MAG: Deoxyribose-phosphate aldolase 1 [Pelotomaculum sp. PtaB.Bin013]|uniref:Deoxyribose-phosphate aldolase n=1 Tax=Pelotomaculum isophthalicicum JI TaxID=947010 RepID=A0A9X4JTF2_9FIRM|nr:deoxyribose-phosphate aldolase [Pelotomaculum isophthalicicum]MDF9408679.1 deoxyribose-phosphate aldolase [Pelotomaculum isophthalicicum JI]OPX85669.1 MAG: Deoxyribose-phosphate aldolase 1 [Pelotomaculum sp. PtaB.Bin013]
MEISRAVLAGMIDHTLLKPEATCQDIVGLCREAVDFGFKSVCINPSYIDLAHRELENAPVGICAVIGFPLGASDPAVKAAEAAAAVRAGASEVDVVMNIGFFKSGLLGKTQADLTGVVSAAKSEKPEAVVKVILETCLLTNEEKVRACRVAVAAGADFVKTSTGFNKEGALAADIKLLRQSVGPRIGVKASGGIRDLAKALSMLEAGADRIGTSAGVAIVNELK